MFRTGRKFLFCVQKRSFLNQNLNCMHQVNFSISSYFQFCLPSFQFFNKALHSTYHTIPLGAANDKDADVFGKLAEREGVKVFDHFPEEDDDDKLFVPVPFRDKKSAFAFHYECKKLARKGKLDECIHMLEETMLKEQKVKPLEINFSVVMGTVARNGNVSKTVEIFKQMKSYGIVPTAPSYTALFNAFAESKTADLQVLSEIYNKIEDRKLILNRKAFNALLKAHAIHDSLQNCIVIFKDSISAGFEPDDVTFTNLLLNCAKDKKNGSRLALQIFRQMLSIDIKPSGLFLLHFLQVLCKCDIGNIALANEVLLKKQPVEIKHFLKKHIRNFRWLKGQESLPNPLNTVSEKHDTESMTILGLPIQDAVTEISSGVKPVDNVLENSETPINKSSENYEVDQKKFPFDSITVQETSLTALNLLDPKTSSELVSLKPCPKPSDRVKLVGGVDNVFELMKQYKIRPTCKLLTVIACLTDDKNIAEEKFLTVAENLKWVKLDADFYNFIMLKRAKSWRHQEAIEILQRMKQLHISPNYRTWCIHAMSCRYPNQGKKLIANVINSNMRPDAVLFTTLIHVAYYGSRYSGNKMNGYSNLYYPNYNYVSYLLALMSEHNVAANKKMIEILEKVAAPPEKYNKWIVADLDFERKRFYFGKLYAAWLKKTNCK